MTMSKYIFYISILGLLYTYFGYPILLSFLSKFKRKIPVCKKNITPKISVLISAYNEEGVIAEKLNNVLTLDYPKEKMEIVVISDASTDKTDEIVKEFATQGVQLYRLRKRSGKIAAYRKAFPYLKGEIVVFSDATSHLEKNSVMYLISNFNDPSVGCVGALLKYINPNSVLVGKGESKYWQYEKKIKEHESSLCSLTSISGTLYAVRKAFYPYTMKEDLADDLIIPLTVKKKGMRTILEPKAVCIELTTSTVKEEMAKRIRITIQNIRGLINQMDILNPFRYGLYSLLVISHKLLRLLVPVFLLMLFAANSALMMTSRIYLVVFMAQVAFYFFGAFLLKKGDSPYFCTKGQKTKNEAVAFFTKTVNVIFYFCLSNLAILAGIIGFFKGRKVATWEPIRVH
jgi:cellulose synthase/poly-beta-1,6-N-acetylglucosamine synthase-like glycosyltransferase